MEWKEVRLGDIATMQYGKLAPKKKDAGNVPIFTGYKNVGYTDKINCNKNTIVVVARGVGGCGDVKITNEDCYLTNLAISVSLNAQICVPMFFYYLHQLENLSILNSGSAQPQITIESLTKYSFRIPSLDDQRRIASILSSLDRKIELNNKINADLEEMAQAIFKNWFVDFEPFKDGKFVDSELGMIPEGWKVGTLGDITKNKSAKVKERNDVKVLSPVTTGELVLSEEYFTKQVFSSSIAKYKIVNKGDFAYNPARVNIGSLGRNEFDFDGCVSPVYVVFSVLDGYENYFDLFRKTDFFKDSVASLAIGGVRQSLSYDDLSSIEVIIPSENAVEEFNNLYNQMKKTIKANKLENSRLSLLRDTLLPRLMSGELEVPQ